jgi:molybdate transport system substrate-binding protein
VKVRGSTLALAIALVVVGCSNPGSTTGPSATVEASGAAPSAAPSTAPGVRPAALTIFAAASLKNALAEAETAYETANPGTDLTVTTDSSAALETQIEQGAPADVFLAADTTNAQKLVDGGFASSEAKPFAGNKLTVIVPTDNPAGIQSPADLAKDGVRIIAAGDEVPITKYATQVVEKLAAASEDPAAFQAAYAANVASKEDNVGQVVAKIELGEGDAGIVYVTDAVASDEVTPIEIPADANVPATYAGVVVGASEHQDAAAAFLDWLAGPDGQTVLSSFGFLPPPS